MKPERDAARLRAAPTAIELLPDSSDDWRSTAAVRAMRQRLKGTGRCVVARAPGRLDVMGGFSDYAGASVVHIPTKECVYVAVQARDDKKILITDATSPDAATHEPFVVDVPAVIHSAECCTSRAALSESIGSDPHGAVRSALATIAEAARSGIPFDLHGGVSVIVHAGGCVLACAGRQAAVSSATLAALTGLSGTHIDVAIASRIARKMECEWFKNPVGAADGACAWSARASALGTFHCGSEACGGTVAVPYGAAFVGLHCGMRHPDAEEKFRQARAAAHMGRTLIQRIVDTEAGSDAAWDGSLATVGVGRYVEQFRDRVPTRIRGRDFIERFSKAIDDSVQLDPERIYKVRSRTEHHIYEQARYADFIRLVTKATSSPTRESLSAMGEVMYGSHWSYGQRCGLGSIETDLLVNLIRRRGIASGLFGARVSGRGCGGIVTVMMADNESASAALDEAIDEYTGRTGWDVAVLRGSVSGVSVDGVRDL